MRPFLRLGMAALVVFLTRATLSAVTQEDCNFDCSALQAVENLACYNSCVSQCATEGGSTRFGQYINFGCFPDPTQEYCVIDGYCICECYFI